MTAFPSGFLWGASTSAHQTEGNNVSSDWWGKEHDGSWPLAEPSRDACDSFHRYSEDIDLLAGAGLASYRFSVEWARIEPAPGEFSTAALLHYQRMVDACLERGVEPLVTLHHFTNPHWVRQDGGWSDDRIVERFARYAARVTGALTGVRRYCTINEPNVLAMFTGAPDALSSTSPRPNPEVLARLLEAHSHAVAAVRQAGAEAGLTVAMTAYTTDGSDEASAALAEHRAADEDLLLQRGAADDFIGVQAYSRKFVTKHGIVPQGQEPTGPASRQTLTGWNYYPQAIAECVRRAHEVSPTSPLLVTENGIATADDEERIAYTSDALGAVLEAIADGVPVKGYYHWSLLDNFEWYMGYRPTFGLVAVDRETFERTPKPSLDWLGRVAKANALPT